MKLKIISTLAFTLAILSLFMPTVLAGEISCSKTLSGSATCIELDRSNILTQLFTITPNTGTNLAIGSIARFTVFQTIKYACPVQQWNFTNVAIYIFPSNNLNSKVDDAFLQVKGDGLKLDCNTGLGATFWYGTNMLPAGTYRMYAQFLLPDGRVLTDSEFIEFSLYKTIEAPLTQNTPLNPNSTTYTPPSTYTPPPLFTPTPTQGTTTIIKEVIKEVRIPSESENKNNAGLLIAMVLIGFGIMVWRKK